MGGDGYALLRAKSDTPLAQLRSRENLGRSSLVRRVPNGIGRGSEGCTASIMDVVVATVVLKVASSYAQVAVKRRYG